MWMHGVGAWGFGRIWTELRGAVRGMSSLIPDLMYIRPQSTPIKVFKDNCVHSNLQMGFRAYPHGINPRSIWRHNSKVPFVSLPPPSLPLCHPLRACGHATPPSRTFVVLILEGGCLMGPSAGNGACPDGALISC